MKNKRIEFNIPDEWLKSYYWRAMRYLQIAVKNRNNRPELTKEARKMARRMWNCI